MKVFKCLRDRFAARVYIERAISAAAKERYQEALTHIEDYETLTALPPRYMILKGMAFYNIGKVQDAVDFFVLAFNNISKDTRLRKNDQKYLATYIVYFLSYIAQNEDIEVDLLENKFEDFDYKIEKVNSRLKMTYQLPMKLRGQ